MSENGSERYPMKYPRFLCGMSRSGTTWLAKVLNTHPDMTVWGETLFWGRGYAEPQADGTYNEEQLASIRDRLSQNTVKGYLADGGPGRYANIDRAGVLAIINGVIDDAISDAAKGQAWRPVDVFCQVGDRLTEREGKSGWVEKSPHHINWTGRILGNLPDAKFVVTLRDAYPFMLSYKHFWDEQPAEWSVALQRAYHPYGCAVIWRGYVRSALRAKQEHPDQIMIVRSERMWAEPDETLKEIQKFFDVDPVGVGDVLVPKINTSFQRAERPALDGPDVLWMNLVARKELKLQGTERQRPRFQPFRIAWSFIRWPVWALRTLWRLRKRTDDVFSYLRQWFGR